MEAPKQQISDSAQDAKDLSISFALLLPRDAADVEQFLYAAARALNLSEAQMARELGVSQATVSSWKARGRIAAAGVSWFTSDTFLNQLLYRQRSGSIANGQAGLGIVLRLLRETGFRPFGRCGDDQLKDCEQYFAGLCATAQFVLARLVPGPQRDDDAIRITRDILLHARHCQH